MERPLLLLGGASLAPGRDCLDQAQARGLPVWLADTAANLAAVPDLAARAAGMTELPYSDPGACAAWAAAQGAGHDFAGVYGFRELAMESVAAVAGVLGLPATPLPVIRLLRDKAACRQALRERGFRQPASALCATAAQVTEFIAATPPGPWVVKPPAAQGSVGISLVHGPAEVGAAITHLISSYGDFAREMSLSAAPAAGGFLAEEFQRGTEYSVEGVCVGGAAQVLAITEKITTGAPHFVEVGHSMPAELSAAAQDAVTDTVSGALRALGVGWGVFHVECWLDDGGVVLGELHNRPGGDHIHTMVQHVTGVELHGVVFDQILGRPVPAGSWRPRGGAAMRFLTPPPGRVTVVEGWDRVQADPRLITAYCGLAAGDVVGPVASYLDRPGYVVATGPTRQAAAACARELCASVAVGVERVTA
jgi:biotin carboxylase